MSGVDIILWLLCVAASFFFSGIETGLLSMNKIRLQHHVRRRDPRALILQHYLSRPDRFFATVLVGNNLVNVTATVLAAELAVKYMGAAGLAAAVALMTLLLLIVGEMLPKSLFRLYPFRLSMGLAMPLRGCAMAMRPLTAAFGLMAAAVLRLAGGQRDKKEIFVSREELMLLAREGDLGQKLSTEERGMIAGVLELCVTPVRDVMLPMSQVLAVTMQTSASEIVRQARESAQGVSRLPVLDAAGKVLGIVNVYDILFSDIDPSKATASDFCRHVPVLDASEPLDRALARLRGVGIPMAVVVDAKSRPQGVVTLTDLVEKIVGEIEL